MYLVNSLTIQRAQQLFIATNRYRGQQVLLGPRDASNTVYTAPYGDKFVYNLPYFDVYVYYNGLRLNFLGDYHISESGGYGTGYDTVTLAYAPFPDDTLFADYVTG